MKTSTTDQKEFQCDHCDSQFNDPAKLQRHIQSDHVDQRPFQCNLCPCRFFSEANHLKHVQNRLCTVDKIAAVSVKPQSKVLRPAGELHECCYCSKLFRTIWNLRSHENLHTGELPYQCQICDRGYNTRRDFKYHLDKAHGRDVPAEELQPATKSKSLPKASSPVKNVTPPLDSRGNKLRYICDICDKMFYEEALFIRHSKKQKKKCQTCRKEFCKEEAYKKHTEDGNCQCHNGLAKTDDCGMFKCNFCDATFKSSCRKKYHENRHKGLRPYRCDVCNARFYSPGARHEHRYNVHGLKGIVEDPSCSPAEYVRFIIGKKSKVDGRCECETCGKQFHSAGALRVHERLHTGSKPFKCRECDASFVQHRHAKNHMRSYHGLVASAIIAFPGKRKSLVEVSPTFAKIRKTSEITNLVRTRSSTSANHSVQSQSKLSDSAQGSKAPDGKYRCNFCNAVFKRAFTRKCHENRHTGLTPYECELCEEKFPSPNLRNHHRMKAHTKDTVSEPPTDRCPQVGTGTDGLKKYKCSYCSRSFRLMFQKEYHENLHKGVKPYKCDGCDKRFYSVSSRSYHRQHLHGLTGRIAAPKSKFREKEPFQVDRAKAADGLYDCSYCDKKFAHSNSIKQHERLHTGERPYKCASCDARFVQYSHAKRHMRIRHNLTAKPLSDFPNTVKSRTKRTKVSSSTSSEKLPNLNESVDNTEQSFPCHICEDQFNNEDVLERHVQVVHIEKRPFHCNSCQRGFYSKANYEKHVKNRLCDGNYRDLKNEKSIETPSKNSKVVGQLFECCYCSKQYSSKYNLRYHEQRHIGKFNFKCQLCQQGFIIKSDLVNHMARKHGIKHSESPSKKGSTSAKLGLHHPCSHCDQAFAEDSLLAAHIRNVHIEQRPFQCSECQRGFFSEVSYQRHVNSQLCRPEASFAAALETSQSEADVEKSREESEVSQEDMDLDLLAMRRNKYPWVPQLFNGPYCFECQECDTKFTREVVAEAHREWHRERDIRGSG